MAEICPVCNEEITSENREVYKSRNDSEGIALHDYCLNKYVSKPEKYGGKIIKAEKSSRAKICPVCNEDLYGHVDNVWYPISDVKVHDWCNNVFRQDPEHYGGVNADVSLDADVSGEEQAKYEEEQAKSADANFNKLLEQAKRDEVSVQEIKDKSVYVKDLDMPIKSMVIFMVKWAVASIPAFIILFIIFGILFLIFGSLFF
jgi:uncharacterized protein YbaR (Trm112 family)